LRRSLAPPHVAKDGPAAYQTPENTEAVLARNKVEKEVTKKEKWCYGTLRKGAVVWFGEIVQKSEGIVERKCL